MKALLWLYLPISLFSQSWSEKTLLEMTLDEKIGQLFMAPACPLRGDDHVEDWTRLIEQFYIGNAIIKHSDPMTQVKFLNSLQHRSKLPLLVSADAEWGLAMRMQNTIAFPRNRTLGAVVDLGLIFDAGVEIGRQAKRVGIHLNLAPVADVNSNPSNPIIGMRSFGEEPLRVAEHVAAIVRGMQSSGILACAKHFPGHGDTSEDSHKALPFIPHDWKRLSEVELVPFRKAIKVGVGAVMSAHLLVPCIDADQPSTLSSAVLTKVLRNELGFEGLIVSDALNMKALSQSPEEIAIAAFVAGCDLLLYGDHIAPNIDKLMREDIPKAVNGLKKEFAEGRLSEKRLDQSVAKILTAKERLGLHVLDQVSEINLVEELHPRSALLLKKKLFEEAVCVQGELFPLPEKTAYLSVGGPDFISCEFPFVFNVSPDIDEAGRKELANRLKEFSTVVVAIHQFGPRDKNYLFSPDFLSLVKDLPKSIVCLFGTPYALPLLSHKGPNVIAFENDRDAQDAALGILRGKIDILRNPSYLTARSAL